MLFVIRWNQSTEMVMLQNLTGGQLCARSYGIFRFSIFIARKKTLGRKMIRTKCLWFVIIDRTRSLNPHLQNYFSSYGTKCRKCHKACTKLVLISEILSHDHFCRSVSSYHKRHCPIEWNFEVHSRLLRTKKVVYVSLLWRTLLDSFFPLFEEKVDIVLLSGSGSRRFEVPWIWKSHFPSFIYMYRFCD